MSRLNQLSANDSPEARREFLRPLPQTAFIPPNLYSTAPTDAIKNLRSDVAAFAERFWSLPESERQSQWTALIGRSGDDPQSRARLRRLEPAVTVPSVSKNNVAGEFGVLLNRVRHNRPQEATELREAIAETGARIFTTEIPDLVAFDKASAQGVPVYDVDDRRAARAWEAFEALGKEITNG